MVQQSLFAKVLRKIVALSCQMVYTQQDIFFLQSCSFLVKFLVNVKLFHNNSTPH